MPRTTLPARDRSDGSLRRAAAAVELALVLPFLAVMFAAAVDLARVFHVTQVLENAAYAAALYGSRTAWNPGPSGDTVQAAKAAAVADGTTINPPLQPDNVTVTVSGGTVTVAVDYDFSPITAVLMPSRTIHLKRTVVLNSAPMPGD